MKEWLALLKKKDIVRSQVFYKGVIGTNEGLIVSVIDAKDQVAYVQELSKFWNKVGAEGITLWEKTESLMVSLEERTGRFRPDLSMIPAAAMKEKTN